MAYVNVKEWTVDQVTEWMKGLDQTSAQYTTHFLNNGVNGHQLLNLRVDDLEHLGVYCIGHQEILLESVELLRNLHYELDKENVQMLALRMVCAARNVFKDLKSRHCEDAKSVPTQTMSDVHHIANCVKPLVQWLNRRPFSSQLSYNDMSKQILQNCYYMLHHTHRDAFADKPVVSIMAICEEIIRIGNDIVQKCPDPIILQPATLDLTTLKKKEQELGFCILASNTAVLQISQITCGSPAHTNSKLQIDDEIVQINYQTVVGWQRKNVLHLLKNSAPELVLTLKKRPCHTKIYGQIYMKPYRLPSRKRGSPYARWNDGIPSPRQLLTMDIPILLSPPSKPPVIAEIANETNNCSSSESDSEPDVAGEFPPPDGSGLAGGAAAIGTGGVTTNLIGTGRLYPVKPRVLLQRRNTISGSLPNCARTEPVAHFYKLLRTQATSNNSSSYNIQQDKFEDDSLYMRDKSVSCSHGLELHRPVTIIGLAGKRDSRTGGRLRRDLQERLAKKFDSQPSDPVKSISYANGDDSSSCAVSTVSLNDLSENIDFFDEGDDCTDRSQMNVAVHDKSPPVKDSALEDVHVDNIRKKFEAVTSTPVTVPMVKPRVSPGALLTRVDQVSQMIPKPPDVPVKPDFTKKPMVYPRISKVPVPRNRGKLDKSHSTPAYDSSPEVVSTVAVPINNSDSQTASTAAAEMNPEGEIHYELGIPVITEAVVYNVEYPAKKIENDILGKNKPPLDVPPKPPPRISTLNYSLSNHNPNSSLNHTQNQTEQFGRYNKPPAKLPSDFHSDNENYANAIDLSTDHSAILSSPQPDVVPTIETATAVNIAIAPVVSSTMTDYEPALVFDPKVVSSPVNKKSSASSSPQHSNYATMDLQKSSHKSSTSNLVALLYASSKGKSKKKNSLIAKRRNVNVADVSPGELQSHLYQRLRNKHTQIVSWERRYFVLNANCLYGFNNKDSSKAECYIYLSGFTVSIASEVKSRTNAFKVYHTGTVFYFSTETAEQQSTWIDLISAATLSTDSLKLKDQIFYSESDDDSDQDTFPKTPAKPDSGGRKFNSLKKFTKKRTSEGSSNSPPAAAITSGSTSLDRKWFFNKSSNNVSSIAANGSKTSVPVKTIHFRSYRKIPTSTTVGNFTSHIPNFASRIDTQPLGVSPTTSSPNLVQSVNEEDVLLPIAHRQPLAQTQSPISTGPYVKTAKSHTSNPSLSGPSMNMAPKSSKPRTGEPENLAGCITLRELMHRLQEERQLNPHFQASPPVATINPHLIRADVIYGEVPVRPEPRHSRTASDCSTVSMGTSTTLPAYNNSSVESDKETTSSCFGKRSGSAKKLNNSLPRITNGANKMYSNIEHQPLPSPNHFGGSTRSLEKPYEMILCPQTVPGADVHFAQNRKVDVDRMPTVASGYTPMTGNNRFAAAASLLEAHNHTVPASQSRGSKLKRFLGGGGSSHSNQSSPQHKQHGRDKDSMSRSRKYPVVVNPMTPSLSCQFSKSAISSASMQETLDFIDVTSNVYDGHHRELEMRNQSPPPTTDYPGLEYPPVFEPETYSLADPQSSRTLLRKPGKLN